MRGIPGAWSKRERPGTVEQKPHDRSGTGAFSGYFPGHLLVCDFQINTETRTVRRSGGEEDHPLRLTIFVHRRTETSIFLV